MDLKDKKILITGANGFVGVNLLNKLEKYHKNIYAVIEPKTDIEAVKNIKYEYIDITDQKNLESYIKKAEPDIVIHLAAYINKDMSESNLVKSTKINVGGTLNILEAVSGVSKKTLFLFVSTGEVYGPLKQVSFKETARCRPLSVYSITKFSAEDACLRYHKEFGFPVIIVRPSVIYGPHQKEGMFVPEIITSLLKNKSFDMTEGSQKRDFIYIEHFIDGMTGLINKETSGIFNVSANKAYTVKDTALMIKKLTGSTAGLNMGALKYRENEIWNYRLDNSKLKKETGFSPVYSIEQGFSETIKWYREKL
ncbi:MAG: NAD(P)-dependent oxidoreductase [Armatimonadota bacterium]